MRTGREIIDVLMTRFWCTHQNSLTQTHSRNFLQAHARSRACVHTYTGTHTHVYVCPQMHTSTHVNVFLCDLPRFQTLHVEAKVSVRWDRDFAGELENLNNKSLQKWNLIKQSPSSLEGADGLTACKQSHSGSPRGLIGVRFLHSWSQRDLPRCWQGTLRNLRQLRRKTL